MNKKIWTKEETDLFKQIYHLYKTEELAEIFNCTSKQVNAKMSTENLTEKKEKFIPPEGMKKCSCCQEVLPLDCFYNNNYQDDGKASECKFCLKLKNSLKHYSKKHLNSKSLDIEKRQAYINKWKGKIIICEKHGEQTIDDYRLYKNMNGNYTRKCRKCEKEYLSKARNKKVKEKGYM